MKEIKDDKHEDFKIIKKVIKENVTETLKEIETSNNWLGRIPASFDEIDFKQEFPELSEALRNANQGIKNAMAEVWEALRQSIL